MKCFLKILAILFVIAVVLNAIYIRHFAPEFFTQPRPSPLNIHAVVVAIGRDASGRDCLIAYDCHSASFAVGKYTFEQRNALHFGFWDNEEISSLLSDEKRSRQIYIDSGKYPWSGFAWHSHDLYTISILKKRLLVNCYGMDGKRKNSVNIKTNETIESYSSWPVFQATNKWIIVPSWDNDKLYMFDWTGKLIRILKDAGNPQLSPDGRYMAYIKYEPYGVIHICDLKNMRVSRVLKFGFEPSGYRFAPDGNSIILLENIRATAICYDRAYAVDLRESHPEPHKLPITTRAGMWAVLDKIPQSFTPKRN